MPQSPSLIIIMVHILRTSMYIIHHCFHYLNFEKSFARLRIASMEARLQCSRNYVGMKQQISVCSVKSSHSLQLQYIRGSSTDLVSIWCAKNEDTLIEHPVVMNKFSGGDFKDHLRDKRNTVAIGDPS